MRLIRLVEKLALMTGIDVPIDEIKLILHQPTIREISYMGEQNFFTAVHYLCLEKESLIEDESLLQSLTNFQVLMKVIWQSETKEKRESIITLLSLFFPDYRIMMTPNSIGIINNETKETITIDQNNFEYLQDAIKEVCCASSLFSKDNVIYNPQGERARKIAEKIYAGRKKIAQLKEKQMNQESILTRYLSILTVGISSMSLENCVSLTMFQLFDLMERYSLYYDQEVDLRIRLAGGQPKKEAENWMKNIHEYQGG